MVVEAAAYTHPWTEGIMRDCLRVGYYCVVGDVGGAVISHAVMSEAVGEAHVLNLCVHPHWRRQGFGRALMEHLLAAARRTGVSNVFLEVRASNRAAQGLYLSMGFNEIGQRQGYYPAKQGREAALVFAKTL
jgi:ribosomal-protein-alanine N-acetyltransferase